jgi:hypothetical protein
MRRAERAYRAHAGISPTDIVDARTFQFPATRLTLLQQRENLNIIQRRKAPDQGEERGNHAIFPRPVDASGNHQGDSHRFARLRLTLTRVGLQQLLQGID